MAGNITVPLTFVKRRTEAFSSQADRLFRGTIKTSIIGPMSALSQTALGPTRFARPVVVVSKCLCGARCRWDGDTLTYPFVHALKDYARIIPVCPEMEIGLGVPRNRIILVRRGRRGGLYQPTTGRELAQQMIRFAQHFLASLDCADGFILKHKSPSCGPRGVKRYESADPDARFERRGTGLFAAEVLRQFPHSAIQDEERLGDLRIREHWLTRLFTLAAWRAVRKSRYTTRLVRFHAYQQLLLNACNQRVTREMADVTRAAGRKPGHCAAIEQYEPLLFHILQKPARRTSLVKPFETALEYYSRFIHANERRRFAAQLRQFRDGDIPLHQVRKTVQVWAVRYDKSFVRQHSIFRPYPGPLAEI